ncbi:MAG: hypothetical protein KAR57_01875 [Bacteroidales bacterium]|nr:hypothetical protein [Bacteroidales bacterium]
MKFNNILILIIMVVLPELLISQNLTSSPYSVFGVGEIVSKGSGMNQGMGGVGIGMKSVNSLNNLNPASYSGIDSLYFIYELSVLGEFSEFSTTNNSQKQFDGNLSGFALGFQAKNWWGVSIGLMPFSSVGYNISTVNEMEKDNSVYNDTYIGTGGINQIYMGNSFKVHKNVSLGLNVSYLFGTLEEDEQISFGNDIIDYSLNSINYVNGLYVDYGLQYYIEGKKFNYTLGAIYGHKRNLNSSSDRIIYDVDGLELYSGEDLENSESYSIPEKMGIGFSATKNNKLTVAFDYTLNKWSDIEFQNSEMETKDSHKFALGLEYSPKGRNSGKAFTGWYYRIGAYYNSSYLSIYNNQLNSKALTFGLGIPVKRNLSMFNVAFQVGNYGTLNDGLIEERFYNISVNFSLQDIWFMKRKFE